MVPASIMMLESLPLTRNGKTDRTAFPAPVWEKRDGRRLAGAPDRDRARVAASGDLLGIAASVPTTTSSTSAATRFSPPGS